MARIKFLQEDFAGFRPDREVKRITDPNKMNPLETIQAIRSGVQATKEIVGAGMDVADFLTKTGVIGPKSKEQLVEEAAKKRAAEAEKARATQREGLVAGQEKTKAEAEALMKTPAPTEQIAPALQLREGKRNAFIENVNRFKSGENRPEYFIRQVDSAEKEGTLTPEEAQGLRQVANQQLTQIQAREKELLTRLGEAPSQDYLTQVENERELLKKDEELLALAKKEGREIPQDQLLAMQTRKEMIDEADKQLALSRTTKLQEIAGTRPLEEQLKLEQRYNLLRQGEEGETEEQARGKGVVSRVPELIQKEPTGTAIDRLPTDQAKQVFESIDKIPPNERNDYQQFVFNRIATKYKDQAFVKDKMGDEFSNIQAAYDDYVAKADQRKQAIQQSQALSIKEKQDAIAEIDRKLGLAEQQKADAQAAAQAAAGAAGALQTKQKELGDLDLKERDARFQLDKLNADPTAKPDVKALAQQNYDTAKKLKEDKQAEVDALKTKAPAPTQAPAPTSTQPNLDRAVAVVNALKGVKDAQGKELPLEDQKKALQQELSKVQDRVKELETDEDSKNKAIREAGAGLIAASGELAQLNRAKAEGKLTPDQATRMVQLRNYIAQNQDIVAKLQQAGVEDPATKEMVVGLSKMVAGGKAPPMETQAERDARFANELKQFDTETAAEIKKAADQGAAEIKGKYFDADQLKLMAVGAVLTNDRKTAQLILGALAGGNVVGMKPQTLTDYLSGDYKGRYNKEVMDILFHLQKGKSPEELAILQQNLNLKTFGMLGALEERFSRMEEREQKGEIRQEQRAAKLTEAEAKAEKAQADAKKAVFEASDDYLETKRRLQKVKEEKGFLEIGYYDELAQARIKSLLAAANFNNGRLGLEREKMRTANANETKNSLEAVLGSVGKSVDEEANTQSKELKAVSYYADYIGDDGNPTTKFRTDFPDPPPANASQAQKTAYSTAVRNAGGPEAFNKKKTAINEYQDKLTSRRTDAYGERKKTLTATDAVNKAVQDLRIQFSKKNRGAPDFMEFADKTSEKAIKLNQLLQDVKTRSGVFATGDEAAVKKRAKEILDGTDPVMGP